MTMESARFTIHDGAEAEEAAQAIDSVPECASWFRRLAGSGGLRHVEIVAAWPGDAG
jgi:hypothetical protein